MERVFKVITVLLIQWFWTSGRTNALHKNALSDKDTPFIEYSLSDVGYGDEFRADNYVTDNDGNLARIPTSVGENPDKSLSPEDPVETTMFGGSNVSTESTNETVATNDSKGKMPSDNPGPWPHFTSTQTGEPTHSEHSSTPSIKDPPVSPDPTLVTYEQNNITKAQSKFPSSNSSIYQTTINTVATEEPPTTSTNPPISSDTSISTSDAVTTEGLASSEESSTPSTMLTHNNREETTQTTYSTTAKSDIQTTNSPITSGAERPVTLTNNSGDVVKSSYTTTSIMTQTYPSSSSIETHTTSSDDVTFSSTRTRTTTTVPTPETRFTTNSTETTTSSTGTTAEITTTPSTSTSKQTDQSGTPAIARNTDTTNTTATTISDSTSEITTSTSTIDTITSTNTFTTATTPTTTVDSFTISSSASIPTTNARYTSPDTITPPSTTTTTSTQTITSPITITTSNDSKPDNTNTTPTTYHSTSPNTITPLSTITHETTTNSSGQTTIKDTTLITDQTPTSHVSTPNGNVTSSNTSISLATTSTIPTSSNIDNNTTSANSNTSSTLSTKIISTTSTSNPPSTATTTTATTTPLPSTTATTTPLPSTTSTTTPTTTTPHPGLGQNCYLMPEANSHQDPCTVTNPNATCSTNSTCVCQCGWYSHNGECMPYSVGHLDSSEISSHDTSTLTVTWQDIPVPGGVNGRQYSVKVTLDGEDFMKNNRMVTDDHDKNRPGLDKGGGGAGNAEKPETGDAETGMGGPSSETASPPQERKNNEEETNTNDDKTTDIEDNSETSSKSVNDESQTHSDKNSRYKRFSDPDLRPSDFSSYERKPRDYNSHDDKEHKPSYSKDYKDIYDTHFQIPNLVPGALYKITVVVVLPCENGKDVWTKDYQEIQGRTVPAQPGECIVPTESDNGQMDVTLTKPSVGKCEKCLVNISRLDESKNIEQSYTSEEFDCKTLRMRGVISPGIYYRLDIKSISGKLTSRTRTCSINPAPKRPSSVDRLNQTRLADGTDYLVTWQAPEFPNGYIHAYEVVVNENTGIFRCLKHLWLMEAKESDTGSTKLSINEIPSGCRDLTKEKVNKSSENPDLIQLNLQDLIPSTQYTVTVTAVNQMFAGEVSSIHFTSGTLVPSGPSALNGEVRSNSEIYLSWNTPMPYPGETDYIIAVFDATKDHSIRQRTITVPGFNTTAHLIDKLTSSTTYNVTIRAHTTSGSSEPVSFGPVTTWNETSGPVDRLHVSNKTPYSLSVQWDRPEHINGRGSLIGYTAYVRRHGRSSQRCVQVTYLSNGDSPGFNDKMTQDEFCLRPKEIYQQTSDIDKSSIDLDITKLDPFVNYDIIVVAYNSFGPGAPFSIQALTEVGTPFPPTSAQCKSPTPGSLQVVWQAPFTSTGPVMYNVKVRESKYPHQSWKGTRPFWEDDRVSTTSVQVPGVRASWKYIVVITPFTEKGVGISISPSTCLTASAVPGLVKSFDVRPVPDRTPFYKVTWECPVMEQRNGFLEHYMLLIKQQKSERKDIPDSELTTNSLLVNVKDEISECEGLYSREIKLVPQVQYLFQIRAKVAEVNEWGPPMNKTLKIPGTRPPPLNFALESPKTQSNSVSTETSFDVQLCGSCMADNSNGEIIFTGVVVCPFSRPCDYATRRTWAEAVKAGFDDAYVVRITLSNRPQGNTATTTTFTVGNNTSCSKMASTENCNGPLPDGKKFFVKAVSCTNEGCTYSDQSGPFITKVSPEDSSNTGAIAGAIVGLLLVIIIVVVVGFLVRRRRQQQRRQKPRKTYLSSVEENGTAHATELRELNPQSDEVELVTQKRPVTISEFGKTLSKFKMYDGVYLNQEFTELSNLSPRHDMAEGLKPDNKPANRWTNIIPFDHSRVKLSVTNTVQESEQESETRSDYINANFVPGVSNSKRYIATQGPLDNTVGDFWRMVWEQGVNVIVMLSQFEELDKRTGLMKRKVAHYFPDEEESKGYQYGVIMVNRTGKVDNAIWEIRTLKLCHLETRKYRFVKHFLFKSWTDHDADISPDRLLEFVHLVRQESNSSSRPSAPLVVHCSAGVGRTGTFLAVDHLDEFLEGKVQDAVTEADFLRGNVDIFGTVLNMRNYRTTLVQTKIQYEFIHVAVQELVHQKLKSFHQDEDHVYFNQAVDIKDEANSDNGGDDDNDDPSSMYANATVFQNTTTAATTGGGDGGGGGGGVAIATTATSATTTSSVGTGSQGGSETEYDDVDVLRQSTIESNRL